MAFRSRNDRQFDEFFGTRPRSAPYPEEQHEGERYIPAQPAGNMPRSQESAPRQGGRAEAVRRRFEPGYDGGRIHRPEGRFNSRGQSARQPEPQPQRMKPQTNRPRNAARTEQEATVWDERERYGSMPPQPDENGDYGFEYRRFPGGLFRRIMTGVALALMGAVLVTVAYFVLRPADGGSYFRANGKLPQPTNVSQTMAFGRGALLDWDAVNDVAGYRVYRLDEATGQYAEVKTAYMSWVYLGDLAPGSSGTYIIRTFCRNGSGEYEEENGTQITVKTRPGDMTAVAFADSTAHSVTLDWQPVKGADGYEIERHTGSWNRYAPCGTADGNPGTADNLSASTEYTFRVRPYAELTHGRSYGGWSDKITAATSPEKIMELGQGDTTDSGYLLSWSIASEATGYEVYRADMETGEIVKLLGQSGTQSYEITGLESVNVAGYRVRAFLRHESGVSYGEFSDLLKAMTLPTQVAGVDQFTAKDGTYTISWQPSERTENYEVYGLRCSTGEYELLGTTSETAFTVSDISQYAERYRVRACASLGDLQFFGSYSEPMACHPYVYLNRKVTVDKAVTGLYTGAGTDFELIKEIKKGTTGRVFGEKSGTDGERWFRVELSDGMTGWLARADAAITNSCKTLPSRQYTADAPIIIYLSPSRQGGNPYCIGNTTEKAEMEAVAAVTSRILKEEYQCVVYTANPELELRERAFEAMELKADVYLAIHSNATGNGSVQYGASSYYCAASARSKKLGENINKALNAIAPEKCTLNKQMYSAMDSFGGVGYAEVRDPYNLGIVPVLAETDFHDNELTARWIMDNHEAIGRAYADALAATFDIPKK